MASQRNLDPHPPLTDIDECQEPMGSPDLHQCDQNCHNNIGSYTCTCNIGWTLDFDGRRCNGKNAPKSYYLKIWPNCQLFTSILISLFLLSLNRCWWVSANWYWSPWRPGLPARLCEYSWLLSLRLQNRLQYYSWWGHLRRWVWSSITTISHCVVREILQLLLHTDS